MQTCVHTLCDGKCKGGAVFRAKPKGLAHSAWAYATRPSIIQSTWLLHDVRVHAHVFVHGNIHRYTHDYTTVYACLYTSITSSAASHHHEGRCLSKHTFEHMSNHMSKRIPNHMPSHMPRNSRIRATSSICSEPSPLRSNASYTNLYAATQPCTRGACADCGAELGGDRRHRAKAITI